MARTSKSTQLQTTAQQLGSLIKSARDIMRKDKGLNGDLDRLPQLTWIMFLKFLDDMEVSRELDAQLEGVVYTFWLKFSFAGRSPSSDEAAGSQFPPK